MAEDREKSSSVDDAAQTASRMQSAYAVLSAAKAGTAAAGSAAGAALGGPLGAVVGALVTNRTFIKIIAALLAAMFLWMFIIANMIGIILSYLGFSNADDFANDAQETQLSMVKTRIEEVLEGEGRQEEILKLLKKERKKKKKEIKADRAKNYPEHDLVIIDEYKTKLVGNLSYYLSLLLTDVWDQSTISSFLGNVLYGDMSTSLTSPYDNYFNEAARTYNVPAALLLAMGMVESGYNPRAVSPAGAMGIMQLMPATAAYLGVSDAFDPRQNIMGGARYISENLAMFKNYPNAMELAVAAYNAGPNAVVNSGYRVPHNGETEYYVQKVMGYLQEGRSSAGTASSETGDTEDAYGLLKNAVKDNLGNFFAWTVSDEREYNGFATRYYFHSESGTAEITKATYETLKAQGSNVSEENIETVRKKVEYTLLLAINTDVQGSAKGYSYKYVTTPGIFQTVLKALQFLKDGITSVKDFLFNSWTDFITGGSEGDSYYGDIDATGDVITYDTVPRCVKRVTYFNQGEEPWASMGYGTSTIGSAGCGPTSLAIVISTLTGQNVNPQMTSSYAISNGEYVSGVGTSHSFPTNAAHHWGLTCERVGKDMNYIMKALKSGKLVVEICEAYTITGSGSGHFIVLTGVTGDGYITIADCASRDRTTKIYSPDTIRSYGRDLAEGCFWVIGR